jgi:hypothetical protein
MGEPVQTHGVLKRAQVPSVVKTINVLDGLRISPGMGAERLPRASYTRGKRAGFQAA